MSRLIPGQAVIWQDQKWILLDIPSIDQALLRDPTTGKVQLIASDQIRNGNPQSGRNGLMDIDDEDWKEAWKRFEALRPLLEKGKRDRTYAEVDEVARQFGRDRATIYRWISKWNTTRTVSSLIRNGRSDLGKSRLPDEVERIMSHQVEVFYLTKERPTVVELWEQITLACRELKIPGPNLSTVRRRVARLGDRTVMAKRFSPKKARETFEPQRGSFPGADVPLAVYQIDHTPIDVSLVDDVYRQPIGRAYLTIVIDTCTRMLAGFCVTFDPPGALATGLAMTHAILPKSAWLAEYDLGGAWAIHGIPAKIYADNAKEFRGTMLERASNEYGIVIENRPKGQPNYGGHVERLFRTFMKRTQSLPGSTFSNIEDRGEYVSDARAVMTLREYTRWFATFVTKVYHLRPHRGIGRLAPATLYEKFIRGDDTLKGSVEANPQSTSWQNRLLQSVYAYMAVKPNELDLSVVKCQIHFLQLLSQWTGNAIRPDRTDF
ncbi:DDE-type integrase/transposase/recombinase [Curvibacter delicatus]|uniref:DDE-type integrase/transposase/recombinase n=1 Tax=Curvibacter delicatus TaxID=80879 RepID=UPI0009FCC36B|nr:DDE-type integrase/transposase/recombinase [Curvibacter delicatus]